MRNPISLLSKPWRSGHLRLLADRPHEADELTSDGGADDGRFLSPRAQRGIAGCEAHLRFPGELPHLWRRLLEAVELAVADARRVTVGPRALDQKAADPRVAGLVWPPRRTVSPVDLSLGTRPR